MFCRGKCSVILFNEIEFFKFYLEREVRLVVGVFRRCGFGFFGAWRWSLGFIFSLLVFVRLGEEMFFLFYFGFRFFFVRSILILGVGYFFFRCFV